jgi:PPP family 3-phenylpropionic acid transporter
VLSPVALYYFVYLSALGFFWPYYGLYLRSVGFVDHEVTLVMAVTPTVGIVVPPLLGLVADARRARAWLLRGVSLAALVAFAAFVAARSRVGIVVAAALFAASRTPVLPMTDAIALDVARERGTSYGAIRSVGSVGFLVAALISGSLVETSGMRPMLLVTMTGLVGAAVVAWMLPAPPPRASHGTLRAWRALLGERRLWLFLGAACLGQAANGAYDACFSLHLKALGHDERFVGAAWAVGVGGEVVMMLVSGRLLSRVRPAGLFAIALVVALGRWMLLAHVDGAATILALQPLHGITFGCFYVAGVSVMRAEGHEVPTAAQGLYAAATSLGAIGGMVAAGRLLERGGGRLMFHAAAVAAAVAAVLAIGFARARARTATVVDEEREAEAA